MSRKPKIFIILSSVLLFGLTIGPFLVPVPELTGTISERELADPDSRFIELEDLEVHYEMVGKGSPTFILLHGFASSTFSWRELIQPVGQLGRVIAYDRPAFGLTERPMDWTGQNPYSPEFQPALLISLMDALEINQAILIGNSAGGTVAVQTALLYPERVQALVLISPALYNGGGPGWARLFLNTPQMNHLGPLLARSLEARGAEFAASVWHDPSRITPDIWEGYSLPLQVNNWDKALWEMTRASRNRGISEKLGDLQLPVLVVSGDDDRIIPFDRSERVAREIPGAGLVEIPNCGHVPQEECPYELMQAIEDFLDFSY